MHELGRGRSLFQLIDRKGFDNLEDRDRKNIVVMTSQVDPKGWTKLFEDPVIAEVITDRLLSPSRIVILKGDSYRENFKSKKTTDARKLSK